MYSSTLLGTTESLFDTVTSMIAAHHNTRCLLFPATEAVLTIIRYYIRPLHRIVKTEPETFGWWINLAYAKRRCEGIESAEAILLRARELHHDNAMIEFNLACYASVACRFEEASN
jgi:hypothetical protein